MFPQYRIAASLGQPALEPLEPRLLLSGFTAYNDTVSGPLTHDNATVYADNGGDAAGQLKDIDSGLFTPVHVSTSAVGVNWGGTGTNPAAETDAGNVFGAFVDFRSANGNNSVEIEAGDSYTYTFTELDPGSTYEFAGTAVRGDDRYSDRWTLVTLEGADFFTTAHSTGIGVVTDGLAANQVALWTGANHQSDQGFIARWTEIDPGADGTFEVISTQYTGLTPGVGTGTAGGKGYGLNGIRLIENVPSGPPAVVNVPAANVCAFEAEIGGQITTTGGQAPHVTIYYGDDDGGTNPLAWDDSVDVGTQSGPFAEVVGNLSQGTAYYFTCYAENALGSAWSPATESFVTLTASAPSVANGPAADVGAFSASLGGVVTDTGNDPPIVTIYYGAHDGGTDARAWERSIDLGVQSGAFSGVADGLDPETTYYFAAYAQNAMGGVWAAPSLSFETSAIPPLQITEFMADNANILLTRTRGDPGNPFVGDTSSPDWIEIHNPTDSQAVLDGYHLSDDLGDPAQWTFPAGTSIDPGGFLVVFASGEDITDPDLDENGFLHTNFRLSDDGGDDLVLADAGGVVVFSYDQFPVQIEDVSYGLGADGSERFYLVPTPGDDNANDVPKAPEFSVASTTFTDTIVVDLTPGYPSDTVHYTLDETTPTAASPVWTGPMTIANTTMLRAVSVGANAKLSLVVGETYIELGADVLDDSSNLPILIVETFGDGVPDSYAGFGDSFLAIFEPGTDGRTRLTDSLVLATRMGIHVRGSSSSGFPKKQYRTELWDEYDEDQKFEVLGMPAEADWILYGPGVFDRALINNALMYDLSNQIGRYAVRTRWVEMYLNANGGAVTASDYVGVYTVMEVIEQGDDRVDVEDLSTGAGGLPVEGGFAWKNDKSGLYISPEDPNTAQRSYIDGYRNSALSAATGSNSTDPDLGYAAWLDVDSFIDHNLLNMLPMNVDALRISTAYFKTVDGKMEAGPIWDFDRALDSTDGRDNNPMWWNGTGDSTLYFNDNSRVILWWPSMFQDPDFVQKYIDRWFELRDGVFSYEELFGTIDAHAAELAEAAPRDYARWSASRYGDFAGEIQHMKNWLTSRIDWIENQWLARPGFDQAEPVVTPGTDVALSSSVGKVYYTLDGSDPRAPGGGISAGAIYADGPITITAYTQITARVYLANHGSTSQGYIPSGDDWSAPAVGEYFINPLVAGGDVAITEINYHPYDPTPAELATQPVEDEDYKAKDFEFVEIRNVSGHTVNIRGVHFDDGVTFTFNSHVLADGQRLVVVRNLDAFTARYGIGGSLDGTGIIVAGVCTGELDNGGERLSLLARGGGDVLDVEYDDSGDWPGRADGKGASLEIIDPAGNLDDPANWRSSIAYGGTPGFGPQDPIGIVVNEVLTHTDASYVDTIELYNISDQSIDIAGWYLSDSWGWESDPDNGNYRKFPIPVLDLGEVGKTLLAPGEYIVFDEGDFNVFGGLDPLDFALNGAHGDDVWLMATDASGKLTHFADHVDFGAAVNGEAFGRWPNGTGELYPMASRTLGGPNAGPRVGPVVISELMYYPGIFHEDFILGGAERFTEVSGDWSVAAGRYEAAPVVPNQDALARIDLTEPLWEDYVLKAGVRATAAAGAYDANAAVVFDYKDANNFKFARLSVDDGEWQIGHRTAGGWIVDEAESDPEIQAGLNYDLKLVVEGSQATLYVEGVETVDHDFAENLHDGSPGLGTDNSASSFGTVAVEPVAGSDLEYIELYNPTTEPIDLAAWLDNPHIAGDYLADWRLRGGVDMEFDENDTLAAKGVLLVLSFNPDDPANESRVEAFRDFYGLHESLPLAGYDYGSLSNGGETVRLQRSDSPPLEEPGFVPHVLEDEVAYDDEAPWPTGADGNGLSLQRVSSVLWGNDASSWQALAPTPGFFGLMADIVDVAPDPRNTPVDSIDIVFSEAVFGFDLADLTLTRDGGGNLLTSESLTTSDHVVWRLSGLADLTGPDGTYVLTLPGDGSGIADGESNPLQGDATESWVMDTQSPTAAIEDITPDPHDTAIAQIDIVFSEPVWGLDVSDLALTRDAGGDLLTGDEGLSTADHVTWTLGGLEDLTGLVGAYAMALTLTAAASGIADAAGNPLTTDAAETYLADIPDRDPPTVAIGEVSPDPRNTPVVEIQFVFSEPVTGFDLADLALTRDAGGDVLTGSEPLDSADGITWTLGGLGGLTATTGQYVVILTAAGSGIEDAGANPLADGASRAWSADMQAPLADVVDVAPDPRNNAVAEVQIVFSEPVTGLDAGDLILTRDGGGNLLTGDEPLETTDNVTWTLGGLAGLTGTAGGGGFVAYNDHGAPGPGTGENTTIYSTAATSSGLLKDSDTGEDTSVMLTLTNNGAGFYFDGDPPAAGTDAFNMFDGYAEIDATANNSIQVSGDDKYTYTFSGLDAGGVVTYTFHGTAIRGSSGYVGRWSLVTVVGAESVTPAHSTGDGVVTGEFNPALGEEEVALWTGDNSQADQGFVVGWTDIDPGADGVFSIVCTQYTGPVPTSVNPLGRASDSKGYALTAIRMEEVGATGLSGAYDLVLTADGSDIIDAVGNPLGADASEAWVTDLDPVRIDGWYTAAEHGRGVGEALLEIAPDGTGCEPRSGGLARLVLDFSEAIDPASFTPASVAVFANDSDTQPVDLSSIEITTATRDGNTVGVVEFAPALPDAARVLVQVRGLADAAGNPQEATDSRVFTVLAGDANGDLRIDALDLSCTWANRTNRIDGISEAQTRSDITADGRVTPADLAAAWTRLGADLTGVGDPEPPPSARQEPAGADALADGAVLAMAAGGIEPLASAPASEEPAGALATAAPTAEELLPNLSARTESTSAPAEAAENRTPADRASLEIDLPDTLADDRLGTALDDPIKA